MLMALALTAEYACRNHFGPAASGRNDRLGAIFMRGRNLNGFYVLAIVLALSLPAIAQETLYNNGPDGDVGYYHVNFGAVVTDSFTLSEAASITSTILTFYDVDDRNRPLHLKWSITTEPLGGTVLGTGSADIVVLEPPYITQFLFFGWKTSFTIPNLNLPAGTYYLQIQDVVTQWDTYVFWAETSGGASQGFYEAVGQSGAGTVSPVPSESFEVMGQWQPERAN
jgi:hypothetical protein